MTKTSVDTPTDAPVIAVARPLLPSSSALLPYLTRIDETRIYSNLGPLVRELQDRLSSHFRLPHGSVATVANATAGLAVTLAAVGARQGKYCLMPAWTFAASAHAVLAAGLKPYFLDVDPETWALAPSAVLEAVDRIGLASIGAVMPVAPFGSRIDASAWDVFHEQTRIPVVIDAAAGFDTVRPSLVPAVVSLHATKVLGAGEGGCVLTRDPSLVVEVQRRSNFGFWGAREARVAATNAKMSEYAAAVGLASLDAWAETRAAWIAVAQAHKRRCDGHDCVEGMPGLGNYATSTILVNLHTGDRNLSALALKLAARGISTRHWWGRGLQAEPAFAGCRHDPLPVTEALGAHTIGLPCSVDLREADIDRVWNTLSDLAAPGLAFQPAKTVGGAA